MVAENPGSSGETSRGLPVKEFETGPAPRLDEPKTGFLAKLRQSLAWRLATTGSEVAGRSRSTSSTPRENEAWAARRSRILGNSRTASDFGSKKELR